MPSRQHETIIKKLVEDLGFQSKAFQRTVYDAIYDQKLKDAEAKSVEEQAENAIPEGQVAQYRRRVARGEADDLIGGFRRNPDAFYLNETERTVLIIEVEHTNPLSDDAVSDYENLWWAFDSDEHWDLEVFTVDRYNVARHLALCDTPQGGPRYPKDNVLTIPRDVCPKTSEVIDRLLAPV